MLGRAARTGVGLGALALALVTVLLAAVGRQPLPEPVYTVATVKAGLQRQRQDWAGRTVLVQGRVAGALEQGAAPGSARIDPLSPPQGLTVRIRLVPLYVHGLPARAWRGPDLWVAPHLAAGSRGSWASLLHRVPLVGPLVPVPPPWDALVDTPGVFRLTLLPSRGTACHHACADALLDDVQT